MADDDSKSRKPSAAVRLRHVQRFESYGNVHDGYDADIDAENSTDISSHDNVAYAPSSATPSVAPPRDNRKWYERPVGIVALTVLGLVLAAIVISWLHGYFPSIH